MACENFAIPKSACENFTTPNLPCENFATPNAPCENLATPNMPCETHAKIEKPVQIHFTTLRIPIASMRSANGQWERQRSLKPTYLKTSRYPICLYSFHKPIYSLRSPAPPCELVFFPFHAPRPPI